MFDRHGQSGSDECRCQQNCLNTFLQSRADQKRTSYHGMFLFFFIPRAAGFKPGPKVKPETKYIGCAIARTKIQPWQTIPKQLAGKGHHNRGMFSRSKNTKIETHFDPPSGFFFFFATAFGL